MGHHPRRRRICFVHLDQAHVYEQPPLPPDSRRLMNARTLVIGVASLVGLAMSQGLATGSESDCASSSRLGGKHNQALVVQSKCGFNVNRITLHSNAAFFTRDSGWATNPSGTSFSCGEERRRNKGSEVICRLPEDSYPSSKGTVYNVAVRVSQRCRALFTTAFAGRPYCDLGAECPAVGLIARTRVRPPPACQ